MNKSTSITVLKSAILFLSLLFVADRGIGYFLKSVYNKQTRGDYYQTSYAIDKAKEDVLIFGSSRALHHYVSDVFEKRLNLSTFNVGRNGRNLLYSHALFSQILTYHTPKVAILDLSPIEFSKSESEQGEDTMIASLLPFADQPSIGNNISRIKKSEIVLSKLFATYPYNSEAIQILGYYFGFKPGVKNFKGYAPLKGSKIKEIDKKRSHIDNTEEKDIQLMKVLEDFLAKAKAKNIEVFVVVSPTTIYPSMTSIPEIRKITNSFGFKFYDCSHLKEFEDTSLFYNITHLNDTGANKFTEYILNELGNDLTLSENERLKKISASNIEVE